MRIFLIAIMIGFAFLSTAANALTVDEIIKLKQAGVSDSTIELLIKRGGDARSAGVWKQDGWIIHSTETRFPHTPKTASYYDAYPITVYPQFFSGRRFWPNKP